MKLKSVLFPLRDSNLTEINHIPVKDKVTYLRVVVERNKKIRSSSYFNPINDQITKTLRRLSLSSRVLLSEAEGISTYIFILRNAKRYLLEPG